MISLMDLRMRLFLTGFGPFQNWGCLGSLLDGSMLGASGVCYRLKEEKKSPNNRTVRTKLVAKMLKLVSYQELSIYIRQICDPGRDSLALCFRARFDLF